MSNAWRAFRRLGLATPVMAITILCVGLPMPGFAAGGGGGGGGAGLEGAGGAGKQRAIAAYRKGESMRNRGITLLQEAAEATDPEEKEEALERANKQFERALREFKKAARRDKKFYQAYNEIGFAQRMLGKYDEALEAYDKALSIEPSYAHAIEYRGEAYMRLGRLDDAKEAYMQLFADQRKLADMLMKKMRAWIALQKRKPGKIPADQLQAFSTWVDERVEIANQTAALIDGEAPRTW
jgi:tetratricopeptide (TPR) repeat protein